MTDPLQAGTAATPLGDILPSAGPIEYATAAVTLAVLALGAYVGYQAYRGSRRNDDRSVLYLGIGVTLVATVRPIASTLAYALFPGADLALVVLSFAVPVAGLCSILYAFTRA